MAKKKHKKKGRKTLKKIWKILLAVCPISLLFTVLQIWDWHVTHKEIDIVVKNEMEFSYISKEDERFDNIYPLFDDYIEPDKEYKFSEKCATVLYITNHYNTEIVLDKIILEAEQIDVDYRPVLKFDSGKDMEDGVSFNIENSGWGDAKNLIIRAKINKDISSEGVSEDYFKEGSLEVSVPIVKVAEYLNVPFLKNSDLIKPCENGTDFWFDIEVECEGDDLPIVYGSFGYFIENGRLSSIDFGGGSGNVYGIKIDTDNNNFRWEENILEFVKAGDTMALPICFYPDKSCTMQFKIMFEIVNDGKRSFISTPLTKTAFEISSMKVDYQEDIESLDSETVDDLNEYIIISYPKNKTTIVSD